MNLKTLINRPDTTPIEEQEAYFILREYVKIRKGVDINPKIETNLGTLNAFKEIDLMHDMLNCAIVWLREHPEEIK